MKLILANDSLAFGDPALRMVSFKDWNVVLEALASDGVQLFVVFLFWNVLTSQVAFRRSRFGYRISYLRRLALMVAWTLGFSLVCASLQRSDIDEPIRFVWAYFAAIFFIVGVIRLNSAESQMTRESIDANSKTDHVGESLISDVAPELSARNPDGTRNPFVHQVYDDEKDV